MDDGSGGRSSRRREDAYTVEEDPPTTISRRRFVKAGAAVAGAAWLGAFSGSVVKSLTAPSDEGMGAGSATLVYHVPQGGSPWYKDMDGEDVRVDEFPLGETAKVYTRGTKAILLHVDEGRLVDNAGAVGGFIAFESTCTHLGCQVYFSKGDTPVGQYPDGIIYCPCHQGAFDPYRGARVLYGPPPRPLLLIPLREVDGRLEAV